MALTRRNQKTQDAGRWATTGSIPISWSLKTDGNLTFEVMELFTATGSQGPPVPR
jgi:hypothetical protein